MLAYGNCDAAAVDDEKKTPWVQIEELVAADVVPNVDANENPDPPPAEPENERQLPFTAKQPPVRLKPTFEVEVALPAMLKPLTVVVPNPSGATDRNFTALEEDATSNTGFVCDTEACTASFAHGLDVPTPRRPAEVIVVVPVAPNAAFEPECEIAKIVVPVALPKKKLPVEVMLVEKRLVELNAVDDAYGNCDAATVDDEKNTPCVRIDVVVAAVVVPKVDEKSNERRPVM